VNKQTPAISIESIACQKLLRFLDGIVLAPALSSLSRHGWLEGRDADGPYDTGEFAAETGANLGYLRIVLKALANQGWITACGPESDPLAAWSMTQRGRRCAEEAAMYGAMAAWVPLLAQLAADAGAERDHREELGELRRESLRWHRQMLSAGLEDLAEYAVGIPAAIGFGLLGWWRGGMESELGEWECFAEELGWFNGVEATMVGREIALRADLFEFVLGYAPLLAGTETLLFGDAKSFPRQSVGGQERHVIRRLDIAFSGKVFAQSCRGPFFDMLLPVFDTEDLSRQPRVLVDVGCGNGLMLAQSYWAICHQTRRGRHLGEFPLDVVGVEYQEVSMEGAAETLKQLQVPGRIVWGDISHPEHIGSVVDFAEALVVCKSTVHNRRFLGANVRPWDVRSESAIVDSDGRPVSGAELFSDLCGHFACWRRVLGRHGMIVIEPHATSIGEAVRNVGRSIATALEITHGYSQQLLAEPGMHLAAIAAAGWNAEPVLLTGARHFGHDYMSFARLTQGA